MRKKQHRPNITLVREEDDSRQRAGVREHNEAPQPAPARPEQKPAAPRKATPRPSSGRRRRSPPELDIVLLCNPQAGGRWRELADILDSREAQHVRRIVTDSIDDVGPALAGLGQRTKLVIIYGGDGTIQRVLDRLNLQREGNFPALAFIGGGTMNVAAAWCGQSGSPATNFRRVVQAHLGGELLTKEVPLLLVKQGKRQRLGFTFGSGPLVRILNAFEQGKKSKLAALQIVLKSVIASWTRFPSDFQPVLREMPARVVADGKELPYERFVGVFCSTTGKLNRGVDPFVGTRTRDSFYYAAYAVDRREMALFLPFLIRGHRPIDARALFSPVSTWKQIALSYFGHGSLPADPRYINTTASKLTVTSDEEIFTVDGEIFDFDTRAVQVQLGPVVRLAVTGTVDLPPPIRFAADVAGKV